MKRFCKECGKEAQRDHKICVHCGTPLREDQATEEVMEAQPKTDESMKSPVSEKTSEQVSEEVSGKVSGKTSGKQTANTQTSSPKRAANSPMSKKKKRMLSVIGTVAVILIGISIWAQSYQSPDAVHKRFYKAVVENNPSAIQKLVVHENGSRSTKGEAEALIELVEEDGEYVLDELFSIQPHGKFLLVYQANKVQAIDQFAYYPDSVKGLTFSFNDVEPDIRKNTLHGPLIPGKYNVEAVFEGDYGETTKSGEITLDEYYGDETWLDMDINIAEVTFYVENYDDFKQEDILIKLGKEELPINEDGETKPVGPFILDGSQQVQTVINMPWGKVESEPFDISESYMGLPAEVLSKDDYAAVTELLTNFGEQYVEAFAENDLGILKNISKSVKGDLEDMMSYQLSYDDSYYSGEFVELDIDRNSVYFTGDQKKPGITVLAQYLFNEDYHALEETPELDESYNLLEMTVTYNTEEKSWSLTGMDEDYWAAFEETDTIEGSKTIFGPSDDTVKAAKDLALTDEMSYFLEDYTRASVDAINYSDFYYVEDYIAKDSPRWTEASEYIDYLDSKNITEDFIDMEIESVEETEEGTWEVTVLESFTIYKEDSTSDKDFRTKLIVKKVEDELYVYELLETNEI